MKNIILFILLLVSIGCTKEELLKQPEQNAAFGGTRLLKSTTFNTGIGCDCYTSFHADSTFQFGWLGFIDGKAMIWNGKEWEDFKH